MYERFISSSMLTGTRDWVSDMRVWCLKRLPSRRQRWSRVELDSGVVRRSLDVEVLHVEGVVLDELAARLDLVAHQGREHQVGFRVVLRLDLEQRADARVHRCHPELLGVHLAQALVAPDRDALAAGGDEVVE